MRSGRQAERRPAARAPRYITAPGRPGTAAPDVGTGGRQDVLLHRDLLAFQHQVRVAEAALLSEGAEGPQQPRRVLGIRHGARSRHAARPGPAARKHLALCRAAPRRAGRLNRCLAPWLTSSTRAAHLGGSGGGGATRPCPGSAPARSGAAMQEGWRRC